MLVDLGSGYYIEGFVQEDGIRTGLILCGPEKPQCKYKGRTDIGVCCGAVLFENSKTPDTAKWKVLQEEPLTLNPSIQCDCGGQHGHIRNGKWEGA